MRFCQRGIQSFAKKTIPAAWLFLICFVGIASQGTGAEPAVVYQLKAAATA